MYGSDKESNEKEILTGTESVKDATKFGRPVIATGKANVSKVRKIDDSDDRHTIRDIAIAVVVSLSRMHFILLQFAYSSHMMV